MLSLLLQLFGVSEVSHLLVWLWQTLKVKLVNLDGHPEKKDTGDDLHIYRGLGGPGTTPTQIY